MDSSGSKKVKPKGEGIYSRKPRVARSLSSGDAVKTAPLTAPNGGRLFRHTLPSKQNASQSLKTRHTATPNHAVSSPPPMQEEDNDSMLPEATQISFTTIRRVDLAILGVSGSGKSTFVQHALDLKKTVTSSVSMKKVSLEGAVFDLRLFELEFGQLILNDDGIDWQRTICDQPVSSVDGVLVLYSVLDANSISQIPPVLRVLSKKNIPVILVSTMCDFSSKMWQVSNQMIRSLCTMVDDLESFQTSITAPETHKRCIAVMMRSIGLIGDGPRHLKGPNRPRAVSDTPNIHTLSLSKSTTSNEKHLRSPSDIVGKTFQEARVLNLEIPKQREPERSEAEKQARSTADCKFFIEEDRIAAEDQGPPLKSLSPAVALVEEPRLGIGKLTGSETDSVSSGSPLLTDSFLSVDQEDLVGNIEEGPRMAVQSAQFAGPKPSKEGRSFDELVDRLLSQAMSKSDSRFASTFLCLYRKFAAPYVLLNAIITRFDHLNGKDLSLVTRITSQLRYLNILSRWISDYPGDFAHPLTRLRMTSFISQLAIDRYFAVAVKEICPYLDSVLEDDDTNWACSDALQSRTQTPEIFPSVISSSSNSTFNAEHSSEDSISDGRIYEKLSRQSTKESATPSTGSSADKPANQSTGSFQMLLSAVDSAQRRAQLLVPTPRSPLTKTQWHQFMDVDEGVVARELTRIDWIMFSSIRPRDLVRHVSLPDEQKEKCRSLGNVDRMIQHFNHIAFWVANLVLLREKPKHRAKALEKCMAVAWKLRQMNNYNALGAIIAGINSTAVHRLAETRGLLAHETQKQFMRLDILMGTQRGHSAYRLAWANTSSERIPFLPLHRRDLVFAEEGNQTFWSEDSDRINWRKFELIGDVVIEIQHSQETPYPNITPNEEVQRLVLEVRLSKDEDVG